MGSKTDQIKGLANQAAGKLKQGVGKITGSKVSVVRVFGTCERVN